MKTKVVRFTVAINATSTHGHGDMPAFLDMLRYESGRVVSWGHGVEGRWAVTIEVEAQHYQPDRWASFGIYPKEIAS